MFRAWQDLHEWDGDFQLCGEGGLRGSPCRLAHELNYAIHIPSRRLPLYKQTSILNRIQYPQKKTWRLKHPEMSASAHLVFGEVDS